MVIYKKIEWFTRSALKRLLYHYIERVELDDLIRLGTHYGGWQISKRLLDSALLLYSFGTGEDISFEVEFARLSDCNVFLFDPTPFAVDHWEEFERLTRQGLPALINKGRKRHHLDNEGQVYTTDHAVLDRLHFYPWGIYSEDQILRFYFPAGSRKISLSLENHPETNSSYVDLQCYSLTTILNKLKHGVPDILKMDVEGAEYPVLSDLHHSKLYPNWLLLEFHVFRLTQLRDLLISLHRLRRKYYLYYQEGDNLGLVRQDIVSSNDKTRK